MKLLICGIDEAGRGPVFGPMVMAAVVIEEEQLGTLKALGVKDSKLLKEEKRRELFEPIKKTAYGHQITLVTPAQIDEAVLGGSSNLNWLEAQTCAELINKLQPDVAVVDCPSPNTSAYKDYLLARLKNQKIKLIVEHKADVNHVIVGAASVLAKVTRDAEVEKIKEQVGLDIGSGYLTDPKTQEFLKAHHTDYPELFRQSWAPYRELTRARQQQSLDKF